VPFPTPEVTLNQLLKSLNQSERGGGTSFLHLPQRQFSSPNKQTYLVVLVVVVLSVDLLPFFLCFVFFVIVEPESVEAF
jgi:hypothetical protein